MDRIDHDARDGERHSRRRVLGTAAGLAAAAGGTALAACGPAAPAGTAGGSTAAPVEVIWTSWAIDDLGLKRVQEQHDLGRSTAAWRGFFLYDILS